MNRPPSMPTWKIMGLLLALAAFAAPDDLPREVVLLSRIKEHARADLDHLPSYTCLESFSAFNATTHPTSARSTPYNSKYFTARDTNGMARPAAEVWRIAIPSTLLPAA